MLGIDVHMPLVFGRFAGAPKPSMAISGLNYILALTRNAGKRVCPTPAGMSVCDELKPIDADAEATVVLPLPGRFLGSGFRQDELEDVVFP